MNIVFISSVCPMVDIRTYHKAKRSMLFDTIISLIF